VKERDRLTTGLSELRKSSHATNGHRDCRVRSKPEVWGRLGEQLQPGRRRRPTTHSSDRPDDAAVLRHRGSNTPGGASPICARGPTPDPHSAPLWQATHNLDEHPNSGSLSTTAGARALKGVHRTSRDATYRADPGREKRQRQPQGTFGRSKESPWATRSSSRACTPLSRRVMSRQSSPGSTPRSNGAKQRVPVLERRPFIGPQEVAEGGLRPNRQRRALRHVRGKTQASSFPMATRS